jgi:uncharacterized protein YggL (DUF469 family)
MNKAEEFLEELREIKELLDKASTEEELVIIHNRQRELLKKLDACEGERLDRVADDFEKGKYDRVLQPETDEVIKEANRLEKEGKQLTLEALSSKMIHGRPITPEEEELFEKWLRLSEELTENIDSLNCFIRKNLAEDLPKAIAKRVKDNSKV